VASNIELFLDEESQYRFRLLDPDGNILAVSAAFPTREAAAAGIYTVRECAGTALVSDNTGSIPKITPQTGTRDGAAGGASRPPTSRDAGTAF
jgi:uncharacterized protein YegP (UPF0339 family)